MRISDWSSDVCSSDVAFLGALHAGVVPVAANTLLTAHDYAYMLHHSRSQAVFVSGALLPILQQAMSGEHDVKHIVVSQPDGALPSRSESVVEGKSVEVRVDVGGRRYIKKQTQT